MVSRSGYLGQLDGQLLLLTFLLAAPPNSSFVGPGVEAFGTNVIGQGRLCFGPGHPWRCREERYMEWLPPIGVWREFVLRLSHIVSKCILKQSSFLLVSWKRTSLPWQPTWKTQRQAQGTALDHATRISHRFPEEGKLLLQRSLAVFHLEPSCIRTLPTRSPSNSPSPIYFSITDSLPLKLVYLLAGVTDDNDAEPC